MFSNRKTLGLLALAAVAFTGIAAAPASAGTYRGGRDNVIVYRGDSCAPRARVTVTYHGRRDLRENCGYREIRRDHRHRDRWSHWRGRSVCR